MGSTESTTAAAILYPAPAGTTIGYDVRPHENLIVTAPSGGQNDNTNQGFPRLSGFSKSLRIKWPWVKSSGFKFKKIFRPQSILYSLLMAVGIGAGAVGSVVAAPVALEALGFTSAGIAVSSSTAKLMSYTTTITNGGGGAVASAQAVLQSTGMAGLSKAACSAVARVGGALGGPLGGIVGELLAEIC
ncbi:uncharacterized protein LOC144206195 isoform X2 [Stigmatopora nigra]